MAEKNEHQKLNQSNGSKRYEAAEELGWQISSPKASTRGRRRLKYCGIGLAVILLQVVVIGVLCLTVFSFKNPNIMLNSTAVENSSMGSLTAPTTINMTLSQEIKVKNKNWGEFKYDESSVVLSYEGVTIGQGIISKGSVGMRKSKMVNVLVVAKIEGVGSEVISSGVLGLKTYAKLRGKVNMVKMMKKTRSGEMNCSLNISLATERIQNFNCH